MAEITDNISKMVVLPNQDAAPFDEDAEDLFQQLNLVSTSKPVNHIWAEAELKFMLLRFWTLKDSIENSNYTVCSMKIWNEPGRKALNLFFAQLGVPLEQAKQKWNYV